MGRQTGCRTPALRGAPLTVCPTRCPAPPSRTAALRRPCCPPTKGGGGAASCRGGGGTTLSPTLALSLTPLTQSSSLWLPLCLHPRLPCSTLLPQYLPCSILLPHILPCSILLPQTLPCSILLPQTLPCSIHLPQTLPCSTLLPQTLSCSILLLLVTEGWGGTLTLPIQKPPCSSLLLAILGWGWATLSPIRPRRINERGRDGAKNVHKACAPLSLSPAPAARRAHSWRGGGGGAVKLWLTTPPAGVPATTAPQEK